VLVTAKHYRVIHGVGEINRVDLAHERYLSGKLPAFPGTDFLSIEKHLSRVREQTCHYPQQGRLPATVGAKDTPAAAFGKRTADIMQNIGFPVTGRHILQFKHGAPPSCG
jgi:hypothetical protein